MKSRTIFRVMAVVLALLAIFIVVRLLRDPVFSLEVKKTNPDKPPSTATEQPTPTQRLAATIAVQGKQWGVSTCYIGAVEGSSRFNLADLQDLGINTYRLYGGIPRWEAENDDGVYGEPTIAQVKADPSIIPWKEWDDVMTHPPKNSDYWWDFKTPRWQGNARTLFSELQKAHIHTMITLRNQDDQLNPHWAPNPPKTEADWNEWWEHTFALVYWLNVRNHYDINDFEIHNEPNIREQGWHGTQEQYFELVTSAHNAIDYVYKTYLPGRTYHVYAPATTEGPSGAQWPHQALLHIPNSFNSVSTHNYSNDITPNTEQIHQWLKETGHSDYPVWLTEWGSYKKDYNSVPFSTNVLTNLLRQSYPGRDYIYGSQIFSLYDFDQTFTGIIDYNGERRPAYYAMRMGIRALQGCRPTYQSNTSDAHLTAITTVDAQHNLYLLVTNQSSDWYDITADLSSLRGNSSSNGNMWEFDASHMDTEIGTPQLQNGHITFTIPASGAVLLRFPAAS